LDLKPFPARVLLSVTTGRLLTEPRGPRDNGIGDLYLLLNHMTGDDLFTHQLPRVSEECKPWLLRWFPELAKADEQLADLDSRLERYADDAAAIDCWLDQLYRSGIQRSYDVGQIPQDDHERKDPYDELVAMRGTDEGIIVVDE